MDLIAKLTQESALVVMGLVVSGLGTILFAFIKLYIKEDRNKIANVEAELKAFNESVDTRIATAEARVNEHITHVTDHINRVEKDLSNIENKVGGIVTGDIAQLYREITTLQGDIKVLASELKNLNSNIKGMFDNMSNDITAAITQAINSKG